MILLILKMEKLDLNLLILKNVAVIILLYSNKLDNLKFSLEFLGDLETQTIDLNWRYFKYVMAFASNHDTRNNNGSMVANIFEKGKGKRFVAWSYGEGYHLSYDGENQLFSTSSEELYSGVTLLYFN